MAEKAWNRWKTKDSNKRMTTVVRMKNRCIPYAYWDTAILFVVLNDSNLFFSFLIFQSHNSVVMSTIL